MDFTGKVALVTGGGRGIGRATALALAGGGADVLVNYLQNHIAAVEVVETIRGLGRRALAVQADVGNKPDVEALFAELDRVFGKIDILVNNAGTGAPKPLEEITVDFWENILRVDLTGPFLCTQAAARRMIPRRYGRIVNVSSLAGIRGADMNPAYTSAKAGLLGFTKSAARYLGKYNVTVNGVSPGPVDTELSRRLPEEIRVKAATSSALGRMGTPQEVADAILFFASDYSRHVTGQMILVDGGIVMP
ncbi:MAG: fabG [Deltaproteobacteria bacterium]|jgi:3-oxoacyl-[acyl-carrier protein] reductase|nr:fabG [Deltaproteobacteria bacterium]